MNYSQSANPNATNSELDSKRIITHKELTSNQRNEIAEQFAELVVDNMDTKDLVRYAIDGMIEYFNEGSLDELREEVNTFDEELYEQLVDNVISKHQAAGSYGFIWDAGELASGNYIVKLDIGDKQYVNTITLLK